MTWRVARSLNDLLAEVNAAAPNRAKGRDGTIGDQAHASRASRHNPNGAGVVTARDVTNDAVLLPIHRIARVLISRPEWIPVDLDYVISDGQVASREKGWTWRKYTGADDHVLHAHFGVGRGPDSNPVGPYDDQSNWHIADCLALLAGVEAQSDSPATPFEEDDMLRLVYCDPKRNEWPQIKDHWFKTDGLTAEWCPTQGHATALKNLGLLKTDSPEPVSPNLLRELGATVPKG